MFARWLKVQGKITETTSATKLLTHLRIAVMRSETHPKIGFPILIAEILVGVFVVV